MGYFTSIGDNTAVAFFFHQHGREIQEQDICLKSASEYLLAEPRQDPSYFG